MVGRMIRSEPVVLVAICLCSLGDICLTHLLAVGYQVSQHRKLGLITISRSSSKTGRRFDLQNGYRALSVASCDQIRMLIAAISRPPGTTTMVEVDWRSKKRREEESSSTDEYPRRTMYMYQVKPACFAGSGAVKWHADLPVTTNGRPTIQVEDRPPKNWDSTIIKLCIICLLG